VKTVIMRFYNLIREFSQ